LSSCLDLSAPFDTADHYILLKRLGVRDYGIVGTPLTWLHSYLTGRMLTGWRQFVKMGQHQSSAVDLQVGVPQRSVLGPLLFAAYCSPVADVIASHGVRFHQYADDTQLHLAVRADNTAAGLSECTSDVTQWYLQNSLQLNPDRSEALVIGTANKSQTTASAVSTVSIARVQLPVADQMKVLGVVLDRRLTFDKHASAAARSCNYHARAIRHICHLIPTDLAQTLACSLILSRIDYCNALLHPASSIQKLERVQSTDF